MAGPNELTRQLQEAQVLVNKEKLERERSDFRGDKVDRKKAPSAPPGGEVLRLRGLPWTAGPLEVAQFLGRPGWLRAMKPCLLHAFGAAFRGFQMIGW